MGIGFKVKDGWRMSGLKPCPFCGLADGAHREDCYMLLLGRNMDAIIDREVPPIGIETLDEAWNMRAERACRFTVSFSDNGWLDSVCTECGYSENHDVHVAVRHKYCPNCGAKVVSE